MPSRAFTLFSMLRRRRSFLMPSAGLWRWKRWSERSIWAFLSSLLTSLLCFLRLHAVLVRLLEDHILDQLLLVVDRLGEVLAACAGSRVCVLLLDKFLTHSFCVFKGLMIWLIVCLSSLRNFWLTDDNCGARRTQSRARSSYAEPQPAIAVTSSMQRQRYNIPIAVYEFSGVFF